jgi:tetratricopeptide (TPR) repeat protein
MRVGAIVVAIAVASSAARAQPDADAHKRADQLFDEGRALMQKGDFDNACPKFEESQKLDPALGTLFNIGLCVEGMGKIRRALEVWRDALAQSQQANEPKRVATAQQHVTALEARVPTVAITVDEPAPGLRVTVGGQELPQASWGQPLPLDPGNVEVSATAPDRQPYTQTLIVREKDRLTIEIPRLASTQVEAPHHGHTLAYGLGAGGGGAVVVAAVLGLTARSKYEHAFSDGQCDRTTLACDAAGQATTDAARSRGNIATVVGAVGLAAIAAGVVVYVIDRGDEHPAAALAPTIGPDGAGFAIVGRF